MTWRTARELYLGEMGWQPHDTIHRKLTRLALEVEETDEELLDLAVQASDLVNCLRDAVRRLAPFHWVAQRRVYAAGGDKLVGRAMFVLAQVGAMSLENKLEGETPLELRTLEATFTDPAAADQG